MEHTRGPWTVNKEYSGMPYTGEIVCPIGPVIDEVCSMDVLVHTNDLNLISAAPELYEVCGELMEYIGKNCAYSHEAFTLYHKAKEAIDKAEGRI